MAFGLDSALKEASPAQHRGRLAVEWGHEVGEEWMAHGTVSPVRVLS